MIIVIAFSIQMSGGRLNNNYHCIFIVPSLGVCRGGLIMIIIAFLLVVGRGRTIVIIFSLG